MKTWPDVVTWRPECFRGISSVWDSRSYSVNMRKCFPTTTPVISSAQGRHIHPPSHPALPHSPVPNPAQNTFLQFWGSPSDSQPVVAAKGALVTSVLGFHAEQDLWSTWSAPHLTPPPFMPTIYLCALRTCMCVQHEGSLYHSAGKGTTRLVMTLIVFLLNLSH